MRFKIADLEVETSPALGDPEHTRLMEKQPAELGRVPRHVYLWDCALEPGGNPVRPKYLVVEPVLCPTVLRPNGAIDTQATRQRISRMMSAAGAADPRALDAALLRQFRPVLLPIPWDEFALYLGNRFRVRFYAWIGYKDMFLRPTAGPVQDRYLLCYPAFARFEAVPVGGCAPPPGVKPGPPVMIGVSQRTRPISPDAGDATTLARAYDEALRRMVQEDPDGARELQERLQEAARAREDAYRRSIRPPDMDEDH